MARAVAGALMLLNPDCVIFGGGVSRSFPLMRTAFDQELAERTPGFARRRLKIAVSDFGDSAGVLGAALLPRHQFEEEEYAATNRRS
jgi:glucokinase